MKQISVDLSQEKLVGVNHYTTMKGGYFFRDFSSNPDTFFVYTLSEKEAPYNTIIGLSFDDSLDIDLQLSLKYIYGDPRNGDNRFMLRNYKTKFKYLTTEQKEKWKLFYINVGNNNKNIKETMFNFAEELSYPLSQVSEMVTFSFEYFLSENDFIPKFYSNNIDTYNKIDTLCTFNDAVPKIYNILNSSLDFKNLSLARTSSGQYIIKFTFYDLNFKLVGTLEDVTIKFIKSIDQILASNPKYSYRIYTSYDDNEFYSKYLIMTEQELKMFEEASAVKLVTIYK